MVQAGLSTQPEGEMPESEIARRGGAVRWRTVTTKDGRKLQIAVVRKPGPRGGHTVAGEPQGKKKGKK